MRTIITIALLFFSSNAANAQWELMPDGNLGSWWTNWSVLDSPTILVPLGSPPVTGYFVDYAEGNQAKPVTVDVVQDSIRGHGFKPENQSSSVTSNVDGTTCNFFTYSPSYEDTSVIKVSASDGTYSPVFYVVGITIIGAQNEYYLSRSTFDTLPSGDTELATLRLFNQTPDTEIISASFSNGLDFNFLDSVSFPALFLPAIPCRQFSWYIGRMHLDLTQAIHSLFPCKEFAGVLITNLRSCSEIY